MSEKCHKEVYLGGRWPRSTRCSRNAVKDGFCKQHHPDAVQARAIKSMEDYERKQRNSIYGKYQRALARIAELEQRWIPCSERLPKYGEPVLVVANGNVVQQAVYMLEGADDCGDWFECMAFEEITFWADHATFWMPLPPPPIEVPE